MELDLLRSLPSSDQRVFLLGRVTSETTRFDAALRFVHAALRGRHEIEAFLDAPRYITTIVKECKTLLATYDGKCAPLPAQQAGHVNKSGIVSLSAEHDELVSVPERLHLCHAKPPENAFALFGTHGGSSLRWVRGTVAEADTLPDVVELDHAGDGLGAAKQAMRQSRGRFEDSS
ncbi:hypothetical protein [Curtobacterium sp. VKM Ac-1376]|uniref:hypothetical protein n=1 Tax=Curtobacterium sp. VKM Ac-1376 TaxID=123312 RepID=UPI00188C7BE8|nr:hypothetical protein [Curtobacterium sp. VKM Ac-1376]MBF4615488.1 hypothetical protein [Curtobacterium sp. VKM Ac-1376]